MTAYTLFGQPASPATIISDANPYTFGVQVSVSQPATLTAVWFYSAPSAEILPATIALYAASGGSLIHSEAATWSGAAASGWVRAAFSSPPSLSASTAYEVCAYQGTAGVWYSATSHYWDSGAGSGGITSGPLSAPNSAGAVNGQDCFFSGTPLTFPNTAFNAGNYWVDAEVTVSAAPAASGLFMAGIA